MKRFRRTPCLLHAIRHDRMSMCTDQHKLKARAVGRRTLFGRAGSASFPALVRGAGPGKLKLASWRMPLYRFHASRSGRWMEGLRRRPDYQGETIETISGPRPLIGATKRVTVSERCAPMAIGDRRQGVVTADHIGEGDSAQYRRRKERGRLQMSRAEARARAAIGPICAGMDRVIK